MKKRLISRKPCAKRTAGILAAVCFYFLATPTWPCTIFVLTDTSHAFFCNNEDWTNTHTRIWFIPARGKRYGAAYVGFDDDYAQGGLNTAGLAFDWVAGYQESWKADPGLPSIDGNGNSGQQMLETCATVEEAIAFYQTHLEKGFYRAKILVADRTGASVIIGAQNGRLDVQRENRCRGFGYGEPALAKMLAPSPEPAVTNGLKILRAALQPGVTKYSNIYSLNSGDIFLYPFQHRDDEFRFNLATELGKGGHYYDMPRLREELAEPQKPLIGDMRRVLLEDYQPIPDAEPAVTAHVRAILQDAAKGVPREDDYTTELWKSIYSSKAQVQDAMKAMGDLISLTLVEHNVGDGRRRYRYRVEFQNCTILQQYVFDARDKMALTYTWDVAWKPVTQAQTAGQVPREPGGVGIRLKMDKTVALPIVEGVVPGSPGEKARIKAESLILKIDGVDAAGKTMGEIVKLIRGDPGTTVKLEIADPRLQHTNVFTLTRQIVRVQVGVVSGPSEDGLSRLGN